MFYTHDIGAGSVLETLRAKKPLLVVVNEQLMDNHQMELARALSVDNYLWWTVPEQVLTKLESLNLADRKEYPAANPQAFVDMLAQEMSLSAPGDNSKKKK